MTTPVRSLVLAACIAGAADASAQGWTHQYPTSTPTLRDVATDGSGLLVAVGDRGALLRSTDGGFTWAAGDVRPGVADGPLEEVDFCGSSLIAGGAGLFLSVDGGLSWARVDETDGILDIEVFGPLHAWAITESGEVLRSTNGGGTWTSSSIPQGFWSSMHCVAFLDELNGWAAGSGGEIYETTDGGATWSLFPSPTNWSIFKMQRGPSGAKLMEDSYVWTGTAAGTGWSSGFFPWTTGAQDFHIVGSFGLVVGWFGRIELTPDGGQSWVLAHEDSGWRHFGVVLTDPGSAVVVGEGARVLRTDDSGQTWTQVHGLTGPAPPSRWVNGMHAIDADSAVAACTGGVVLRTDDGGLNWTEQDAGTAQTHLTAIHFHDDLNGYAVGKKQGFYPTLCSTHDGGQNWHEVNQLGMYDHHDVVATGPNEAVVGSDTRIWRTTDGGSSWSSVTPMPFGTYRAIDVVGSMGLAVGSKMVRSTDGGVTWTHTRTMAQDAYAIDHFDAQTGWLVGEGGMIEKTVDGGLTWTPQSSGVTTTLRGVHATTLNFVFATGDDGTVLWSSNGGQLWQPVDPAELGTPTVVGCAGVDSSLWIGCGDAGIWRLGQGPAQCEVANYCTAKIHSLGGEAEMALFGQPSISNQFIGIGVIGALPSEFGLAFRSESGALAMPLHGGTLCVEQPLTRMPVVQLDASGFGYITVPIDPSWVGETHWFQYLFRDPQAADGSGIGMSDGLRLTFCP